LTILIFGVVVLVHEWGHFMAARKAGIFVEEFAIGMGPKLWSTKPGAEGEYKTVYSLRLLPIGGFCKMLGEDENRPDEPRALNNKKVWQRMLVMVSGAFMNFLLAFLVFLALNFISGFAVPEVRATLEGSPAQQGGLVAGDRITHVNGDRVWLYEDFIFELTTGGGKPMDLRVNRGGQVINLRITPMVDANGDYKLGFYPGVRAGLFGDVPEGFSRVGFFEGVATAFNWIPTTIKMTVVGIYRMVTGQGGGIEMSGMIGIASDINTIYESTLADGVVTMLLNMLGICGLISANLGIMNLLPLPALDGGRLVFLIYEGIRRKPVSPEREGTVHFVGFILLMVLAVFIAYQDILKLL
jgi:regulator of sigma E protease